MTDDVAADRREPASEPESRDDVRSPRQIAGLFLKLGMSAFGGPAAHIAIFEEEMVVRRKWLTRGHFLDLLGATHLVPGPNSTEMAIHLGYVRAGVLGAVAAGVGFIVPAFLAVLVLAWTYVRLGTLPAFEAILAGITPVVMAIIAGAGWRLGRKAIDGILPAAIGIVALLLAVRTGTSEIWLLFGAGLAGLLGTRVTRKGWFTMVATGAALSATWADRAVAAAGDIPAALRASAALTRIVQASEGARIGLAEIFGEFLRVGAILFGSGYVLIAYLDRAIVQRRGWLDATELLDAIAVGQVTPGPVLTTAAFVGYLLRDGLGAVVATVGIFLPSFLIVLAMGPIIPRIRESEAARSVLLGVNAAVVALIAAVLVRLGEDLLQTPLAIGLAVAAFVAGVRFDVPGWVLVLIGAGAGWARALLWG